MESVITFWSYILLGLKLTKLFGIEKIPVAKDSGKVLIIIIYYIYNYSGGVEEKEALFPSLPYPTPAPQRAWYAGYNGINSDDNVLNKRSIQIKEPLFFKLLEYTCRC